MSTVIASANFNLQGNEASFVYEQCNAFLAEYLLNVARGGTFVRSEAPRPVGTVMNFRYHAPGLVEPLQLLARVVWVNARDQRQRPDIPDLGMGVLFFYRDAAHREKAESTLRDLLVSQFGEHIYGRLTKEKYWD